jgi:hypothetical protein
VLLFGYCVCEEQPKELNVWRLQTEWKCFFSQCSVFSEKLITVWKVSRLHPFVLRVRTTSIWMMMNMELCWNDSDSEKPQKSEEPSSIATLSATNLTWTEVESNCGFRKERPATNFLSHGTS